jgi:hypothetical protein
MEPGMKIWCFDDAHTWGANLAETASKRGHECVLFDAVREVRTGGILFYHMHAHPAVRDFHKRAMAQFATVPSLKLIPSYRLAQLYDDRIEQLRVFGDYMPPTQVFRSPALASEYLETGPDLPMVSKTQIGPGVRMLETIDAARREIKLAFSDFGLPNRYKVLTHGALYWQQLVQHDWTYRVYIVGSSSLIEMRKGTDHSPVIAPDQNCWEAVSHARSIFDEAGLKFGALDLIKCSVSGSWYLMKVVAGWPMRRVLQAQFVGSERKGVDFWEVFCDELEKGNLL